MNVTTLRGFASGLFGAACFTLLAGHFTGATSNELDTASNVYISEHFVPSTADSYVMGLTTEEWATVWVNHIDDGDGIVTIGADLNPSTDATYDLGVSGTEYAELWVDDIDAGRGWVNVNAGLSVFGYINMATDGEYIEISNTDTSGGVNCTAPVTCAAGTQGTLFYCANTTGSKPGGFCACMDNGGTGYAWESLTHSGATTPQCP